MASVFVVLLVLMGIVNVANFVTKDKAADDLLEILAEHGGKFPNQGPSGQGGGQGMGGLDPGQGGSQGMGGLDPEQGGMIPPDQGSSVPPEGGADPNSSYYALPDSDDDEIDYDDLYDFDYLDDLDGEPFEFSGRPGMSEETPYETRFFSVTLSDSGLAFDDQADRGELRKAEALYNRRGSRAQDAARCDRVLHGSRGDDER